MIKVGIDIQATRGQTTGLGVYTTHLIRELPQAAGPDFDFLPYKLSDDRGLNTPARLLWENLHLPGRARADKVDLLHVPAYAPPMRKQPFKVVVTVHDLIGLRFSNQLGIPSRLYWGKWLPAAVGRADAIIADSCATRRDISECLRVPEERVRVVYPSGHENFTADIPASFIRAVKARHKIEDKYFLTVGTLEPRKNLERVIQAFGRFKNESPEGPGYQLVLTGSKRFAHGIFFKKIVNSSSLQLNRDLVFPGYVDHETLNVLYAGARALLFPSLYEGFGIPILEAMASGTPVVTSRVTSMPEVAGDAAILVDPYDTDALAKAMKELAAEPLLRQSLIQKGFVQMKKFSWEKTARETVQVYREVLGS